MIKGYFDPKDLEQLPDEMNWKGYWGRPGGQQAQQQQAQQQQAQQEPTIVHFHGPKPHAGLECLVLARTKSLDVDAACPTLPEVYRWAFKVAPDAGAYYVQLLVHWHRLQARFEGSRLSR
jgi:hypothetical protein